MHFFRIDFAHNRVVLFVRAKIVDGEADFSAHVGRSKASDVWPINFMLLNPRAIHPLLDKD